MTRFPIFLRIDPGTWTRVQVETLNRRVLTVVAAFALAAWNRFGAQGFLGPRAPIRLLVTGIWGWLLISLARRPGYDYGAMREWMSTAWVAVPMLLLVLSVFYHFRMGLQVVIEDYQRDERRVVAMVALNLFTAAVTGTAIFAILKIAFGAN